MDSIKYDPDSANRTEVPRVLLVAMSATQSQEILRFATVALKNTTWNLAYLAIGDPKRHDLGPVESLRKSTSRLAVLDWRGPQVTSSSPSKTSGTLRALSRRIVSDYLESSKVRTLFSENEFDLVILCTDGVTGPLKIIARANSLGIPSLILPWAHTSKGATYAALIEGPEMRRVETFMEHLLARAFPRWVESFESFRFFRLPPKEIIYRELVGLTVPNPWTLNGGKATIALVDSELMLRNYLHEGVPLEKIRVVGSLIQDELSQLQVLIQMRSNLIKGGGKPQSSTRKLRVLVAFPPSYLPAREKYSEFQTYEDLISNWILSVESRDVSTPTYQAHPHTDKADLATIEAFVDLSTRPIFQLVSECDVLITTDSSIIKAAILLEKPVINYDAYGWTAPLYDEVRGVMGARTLRDVESRLHQLSDANTYEEMCSELAATSSDWGRVDGNAWRRIRAEIELLLFRTKG